jgi:hypothetical protein
MKFFSKSDKDSDRRGIGAIIEVIFDVVFALLFGH